jgi:hypothetical protein
MTLRANLIALLAYAGIIDVDIDKAVEDEHVRLSVYQKVIANAVLKHRNNNRAIVSTILYDPIETVSKTAVVYLVDKIATRATDPADFQQSSTELLPEIDQFKTEGNRKFVHRRIHDWTCYLAIKAGHTPTSAQLSGITNWMQRTIAEESTSLPILTLLAEDGRTKKIRNIARNRAGNRKITTSTDSMRT